jgi:hypothetical protein
MRLPTFTLIGALALSLMGCITSLEVRKTGTGNGEPQGIRYSLPVPLLQVCPGPDATLSVQEIFLPDEDSRYAISAKTYAAKFSLNVDLEDGLLKKLEWNPDSTAVAEQVAESAGNLAKAKFEANAKTAEEAAKKEADAVTAQKTALDAADKLVQDAEAELRIAAAVLASLHEQPNATAAQIVEAEVNVAKARAKLESALAARSQLRQKFGLESSNTPSPNNATPPANNGPVVGGNEGPSTPSAAASGIQPTAPSTVNPPTQSAADRLPTAFGCVFYRIVETADTLELQIVEPQRQFQTLFKASPAKDEVPLTTAALFRPETSQVVRPQGKHRELVLNIMANVPLKSLEIISLERQPDGKDVTAEFPPALTLSGSGFRVDLDDRTPSGRYKISFSFQSPARKNNPGSADLEFQVRR